MSYVVTFRPKARKAFLDLPKPVRDGLAPRLDALAEDPKGPGTKALQGKLKGLRSLRMGNYRVLYTVDEVAQLIEVLAVGPRESIYS